MKVVLIEDEVNVREGFIKMLSKFCPELQIVGTADSVESGIVLIESIDFDLLFLDINLPDGSGFDLIHRLDNRNFHLIFVTAYDKYAIDAFKLSAVDYLLKPVSPDLLQNAVKKAKILPTSKSDSQDQLEIIAATLQEPTNQENKIILKDQDSMHLVQIKDIIYCHAEGSYTTFYLISNRKIITSSNLKEYETILKSYRFLRSHHSYLVNLNHVKELKKLDGGYLITSNDTQLPISSRKKAAIVEKIKMTFLC